MKCIIRGKNGFTLTDAIERYIEDKISKIDQYFKTTNNMEARVICKVYSDHQKVEVTIPTNHFVLRAEESHEDLYAAIDLVIDKLDRQIRRHKDRINSVYKNKEGISDLFVDEEFDINQLRAEIVGSNLVRNKQVELKPMESDEAILQMEMLGHGFYVYLDKDSGKVSVVYKRNSDGDYAVIETH